MNKNIKNKVLSSIIALSLILAMWASWVLWGFWRTVNNTFQNMTWGDEENFGYGYWYGDYGWWYGYWYGYWYGNTYELGYYTSDVNVTPDAYSGAASANNDISSYATLSDGGYNVTTTVSMSSNNSNEWRVVLPNWLRITWSQTLPTIKANSNVSAPVWNTIRWAVRFWVNDVKLLFSVPVRIEIPVSWSTSVNVKITHEDNTTSNALSTTPWVCNNNGTQVWWNSTLSDVAVSWGYAVVYTCSASEFVAYSTGEEVSWGNWGGSSWGWWGWSYSYTPPKSNTTDSDDEESNEEDEITIELPDNIVIDTDENGNVIIDKGNGEVITFWDINNTFAKEYIIKLAALGIINWYNDGTFKPENNATRAEYLKIVLWAMWIDYSNADTSSLTFGDVDSNSWIAKVVVKASELGLIDSTNNNFRPNDYITRAESMKMLLNAASIEVNEVTSSSFADVNVNGWEAKYIETAKNLWIVDGQMINWKLMFRPFSNITRAEVSKIVVKTMDK